jgi:hypothetical protein
MANKFWLYQWIDQHSVTSQSAARKILGRDQAVEQLRELAASQANPQLSVVGDGGTLLAGRGIDLSGDLDCCHHVCQQKQVDALFRRVWHYFDQVAVVGPSAIEFADSRLGNDAIADRILEHVDTLLYLRRIGAEELLLFTEKAPACSVHYVDHAREAGVADIIERAQSWKVRLVAEGTIEGLERHEDHWHYAFSHPDLEHFSYGQAWVEHEPTIDDIAEAVLAVYVAHLVSDVATASELDLPLGASVRLHEDVLSGTQLPQRDAEATAAFQLELPFIDDVPISDLIRIRQDEYPYFDRFRRSLSEALTAALDRSTDDTEPRDLAREIENDVIAPALMDIERRLRSAERTLTRKALTTGGVAGAVTTVGLLLGMPLIVGGGVASAVTTIPALHKYLDDRGAIELSDMYFLWHAQREALRSH